MIGMLSVYMTVVFVRVWTHSSQSTLLYVPTLAVCMLAVDQLVVEKPDTTGSREARSLLAMALGFFGRLSSVLPSHDYFDLVAELVDMVGFSNAVAPPNEVGLDSVV